MNPKPRSRDPTPSESWTGANHLEPDAQKAASQRGAIADGQLRRKSPIGLLL